MSRWFGVGWMIGFAGFTRKKHIFILSSQNSGVSHAFETIHKELFEEELTERTNENQTIIANQCCFYLGANGTVVPHKWGPFSDLMTFFINKFEIVPSTENETTFQNHSHSRVNSRSLSFTSSHGLYFCLSTNLELCRSFRSCISQCLWFSFYAQFLYCAIQCCSFNWN